MESVKHQCAECQTRRDAPISGHSKCAKHRACSGPQSWQPDDCDICLLVKYNILRLPIDDKAKHLDELFNMLKQTAELLSSTDITWEYESIFQEFMGIQGQPQSGQHEHGVQDRGENQPDKASSMESEVGHQASQSGDKQPTTNELLQVMVKEMIGGFKELKGFLLAKPGDRNSGKTEDSGRSKARGHSPSTQSEDSDTNHGSGEPSKRSRRKKRKTKRSERHSRKRQRRSRSSSEDENDSTESEYGSDSEICSDSSQSPSSSPHTHQAEMEDKESEDFFIEGGAIFFHTGGRRVTGNKVWFRGELRDVRWHTSKNAFSLLGTTSDKETPFMSPNQAHEALVTAFNTVQDPSEKPGLDRKSFRAHFDDNSGLAQALRLIQQSTPDALLCLIRVEQENFWKSLNNPAFKPFSMVNFTSGWNFTNTSYFEWAKNEKLDPQKFASEASLTFVPAIPNKFLEAELRARAQLVNAISGLGMLDLLAKQLKDNSPTHTATEAISRHFLTFLSDYSLRWYMTKSDIRKIVLQGSLNPFALDLLLSNMWEPTIFSRAAVKKLIESDVPRMGLQHRLEISEAGKVFYYKNPNRAIKKVPKIETTNEQFFREQQGFKQFHNNQNTSKNFQKNWQPQNNRGSWGGKSRKQGKSNQKQNRGNFNKNKNWSKSKQGKKAGTSKGGKGNQTQQQ